MFTIVLQALAWLTFITGTVALGAWLRRHPAKRDAERASRILHFLFWAGIVPAAVLGVFNPGLTGYDQALGLSPLPQQPVVHLFGALGLLIGVFLILVSNLALGYLGGGANAFWLTDRLVAGNIYGWMRNPMSLGLYLVSLGLGLLVGSNYMTLGALFGLIPAHAFYLKYFEEYELELRIGQSYVEYKQRVPFMLPRCFSHRS